jgi:CBS domain-containing protein
MFISDIMVRNPHTCSPDDSLNTAAELMWEHDCGCLPVVDANSKVVGMITDRDICMAAYTQGVPLGASTVATAMSRDVCACTPADSVDEAEEAMEERQVRRIPVVDAAGVLLGIVSLADLAHVAQRGGFKGPVPLSGVVRTLAEITEHRTPAAAE